MPPEENPLIGMTEEEGFIDVFAFRGITLILLAPLAVILAVVLTRGAANPCCLYPDIHDDYWRFHRLFFPPHYVRSHIGAVD